MLFLSLLVYELIVTSFPFAPLLWRSRHFHDRRTEEVLQCHEKTGLKEASETHSPTSGEYVIKGTEGKNLQSRLSEELQLQKHPLFQLTLDPTAPCSGPYNSGVI